MDSYKYFASGFVSKVGGRVVGDYFVVVGNVSAVNLTKCMITATIILESALWG